MKNKNIFNGMGFAGRLGKLGDVIESLQNDVAELKKNAKVRVTFDSDGGSNVAEQLISYGAKAATPTAPTKSGHTFTAWTLGGKAFNFDTPVTGDITLKATWGVTGS